MNIKDYWKSVRKGASELDPESAAADAAEQDPALRTYLDLSQKEIWLFSVRNESVGTFGGRVVSARPFTAARLLKESTHVLASPRQVDEYKAELAQRREQMAEAERERKGPAPQIVISQEVLSAAAKTQRRPPAEQGVNT